MIKIEITKWQYEDEMTEDDMYDALFALSKVDGVRMFPKEIRVIKKTYKYNFEDWAVKGYTQPICSL